MASKENGYRFSQKIEAILLSDCFGRDNVRDDIMGWIGLLKLLLHLTGVKSLFCWFQHWMLRDSETPVEVYGLRRIQYLEEQVELLRLEQERLTEKAQTETCVCECPVHGSIIGKRCVPAGAPPPLPPPPPPPPPPPVMSLTRKVLTEKNNNDIKKSICPSKGLTVTADDLQLITLKKTKTRHPSENGCTNSTVQPLVTENDLRNRKLNKVMPCTPSKENLQQRIALEVLGLRSSLKKTEVRRSPGGTPLFNRKKARRGSGLAPVMAMALKKKFVTVHSPDTSDSSFCSPLSTDTSPFV